MTNELGAKISGLVDILRAKPDETLAMADIAMVTEVLISTMQRYFGSVDTQIYREFRELATYIEDAKSEIGRLQPGNLKQEKLPRAGMELDAIVKSTEEATNTIMEAAESLMAIESRDADEIKSQVMDRCMAIFEACSFQDITGQRISKVVDTLTHIEDRLAQLQHTWWSGDEEENSEVVSGGDAELLSGPALEGEGVDQSFIDKVMEGSDVGSKDVLAQTDSETPSAESTESSKTGTQSDIDALFD